MKPQAPAARRHPVATRTVRGHRSAGPLATTCPSSCAWCRLLLRLAVILVATLATTVSASAATFADVTAADLVRAGDLAIIGRVEQVDAHPAGPTGQPRVHTRAVIQVGETRRDEHRTLIEVWAQSGRIGDRARIVSGQATFRADEDIALSLFEAGGGLWPIGMARGVRTIQPLADHFRSVESLGSLAPPTSSKPRRALRVESPERSPSPRADRASRGAR